MTSQTLPPMKNAHLEGSDKNIPKEKESKHEKKKIKEIKEITFKTFHNIHLNGFGLTRLKATQKWTTAFVSNYSCLPLRVKKRHNRKQHFRGPQTNLQIP